MTSNLIKPLATAALIAAMVPMADAASVIPIAPGNVSASSQIGGIFDRQDDYIVDGSGLAGGTHTTAVEGNMWLSTGNGFGGVDDNPSVSFDLGGTYIIESFRVWNYNENPPNLTNRGVNGVTVEYGESAALGSTVSGVTNFAQANASGSYAGEEFVGSNGDFVSSSSFLASNIKFDINSNHGDGNTFYGLSEVQFTGTAVPTSMSEIDVPNGSFEDPAIGSGGVSGGVPSGWDRSGSGGIFRPNGSNFDSVNPLEAPADGNQYAFLETGTGQPGTVSLTSSDPLATSIEGAIYKLTAAVGHRNFDGAGGRRPDDYRIEILLDGDVVAWNTIENAFDGQTIPSGEWFDLTAWYVSDVSGGDLTVRLLHSSDDGTFRQGAFDNVRFYATPSPTAALAGLIGLGGLLCRRRRA